MFLFFGQLYIVIKFKLHCVYNSNSLISIFLKQNVINRNVGHSVDNLTKNQERHSTTNAIFQNMTAINQHFIKKSHIYVFPMSTIVSVKEKHSI